MRFTSVGLIVLLFGVYVQAQSLYNNSQISISPNTIVFVKDSIINNGQITNNGDMQVSGAWINNNQYDAGQGQITFNSNDPQVINHHDQAFSKLTISGGGEKIFQANITIENELNLSDGILTSQNNSKIIFGSNAQVTGGSDQAHINGPVYHKGAGMKLFPVGNGLVYLPLELLNVQGATTELGVHAIELNGTVLQKTLSLDDISNNRYWQIDVVSGSLGNSAVVLPVRNESIVTNEDQVVVAQSTNLSLPFETIGRSAFEGTFSNGKVTSAQFATLPFLAIGIEKNDKSISVYNAVSPNGDGLNDFLRIGNIEKFPNNKVSIFNRWGDRVFEMSRYNNNDKAFRGRSNTNGDSELSPGTYFYVIDKNDGSALVNGYLSLKN
jgi:gliding motility-associated-like protein